MDRSTSRSKRVRWRTEARASGSESASGGVRAIERRCEGEASMNSNMKTDLIPDVLSSCSCAGEHSNFQASKLKLRNVCKDYYIFDGETFVHRARKKSAIDEGVRSLLRERL
jgi:hypothetical protein